MNDGETPPWSEGELAELHAKMVQSDTFLALFNEGWRKDPTCLVQLGFAMMLEKPILLLVPHGTRVPSALRRVADSVQYYDPDDRASFEAATTKILAVIDRIKRQQT